MLTVNFDCAIKKQYRAHLGLASWDFSVSYKVVQAGSFVLYEFRKPFILSLAASFAARLELLVRVHMHVTTGFCPCLLISLSALTFAASKPNPLTSSLSVTVLVDFEKPHSEVSLKAMRESLAALMAPAGIATDVAIKSDLPPGAQFAELVVFKMKGYCTMDAQAVPIGAILDERGPLALAYASDGEVLHFGEVECDHIRHSLGRLLGAAASVKNQTAMGHAMAKVMAHEIYHMLGNAKEHTHKGLTKTSLSADELLDGSLKLPDDALAVLDKLRPNGESPRP